jgi:glutamate synthase (NADPH/NADH) small chain
MLRYGIPRFKLDHRLVGERMDLLRGLGVEFVFDTRIGRDVGVADLFALGFEAVFLGTGAPEPIGLEIPGVDLKGVLQAPSFLVQANVEQNLRPSDLEDPPEVGETVVVIGGGDTGINCSRAALRLGAAKVICLYRRGREEMSGNPRDQILATEEGVEFRWCVSPDEVLSDGEGGVRGLGCVRTRLGPPDGSGRPAVEPVPGSGFQILANTVVFALGSGPDPTLTREISGLAEEETGFLKVDPATGRTGREMVWAGGENVTGPSPVARAVAQGRAAAEDIHRRLCWRQ